MMISTLFRTVFLTFALALAQIAGAATVFNNGGPNYFSGTRMSEFVVADNFNLADDTNITNIRFWSHQSSPADYSGTLAWSIYENVGASNTPGSVRASGSSSIAAVDFNQRTAFGSDTYIFNIPVTLTLLSGSYWLGLNNSPLNSADPSEMLWATTQPAPTGEGVYLDSTSWVGTGNEHAFLLEGTAITSPIPEPYMPAMMLAGLATLAGLCRFKRLDKSSPNLPSSP
jgi:hypothetical protein